MASGQFRPEVPHLEDEGLATQPAGDDAGDARRQGGSGGKEHVIIAALGDPGALPGEPEKGQGTFQETIPVGVRQFQLDDVDAVHQPLASAALVVIRKTGLTAGIGAADHRDLMSGLEQAPGHGIGAVAGRALGRREMLVVVKNLHALFTGAEHRLKRYSLLKRPGRRISTSSTGTGARWR